MSDGREFGRLEGLFEAQKEYISQQFEDIRGDIREITRVLEKHGDEIKEIKVGYVKDRRKEMKIAGITGAASGIVSTFIALWTWIKARGGLP